STFADQLLDEVNAVLDHESDRAAFLALSLFPELEVPAAQLAALAARNPADAWMRKAIASSFAESAADVLLVLLADQAFLQADPESVGAALGDFASLTAAKGDLEGLARVCAQLGGEPDWWHFS